MEIARNLEALIAEARERGWRGEVSGLEATLAAARAKLDTMNQLSIQDRGPTYLGIPTAVGRWCTAVAF
jgi:hypothetical protein